MFTFQHEMNRNEVPAKDNSYNMQPFFHWKEALTDKLLLGYIDGLEHKWEPAQVGASVDTAVVNRDVRNHDVSVIEYSVLSEGLFRAIHKLVESINFYHYNFRLWAMEDIQASKFDQGSFFVSHIDRSYMPSVIERKLTVIVGLTDHNHYEGGDIVFYPSGNPDFKYTVRLNRGDMLVFPCWVPYENQPVTQGSINLLQTWVYGPKFV